MSISLGTSITTMSLSLSSLIGTNSMTIRAGSLAFGTLFSLLLQQSDNGGRDWSSGSRIGSEMGKGLGNDVEGPKRLSQSLSIWDEGSHTPACDNP